MTPTGIAIIVGFALILAACVWADRNKNKKVAADIAAQYPAVDSFQNAFVTAKGELLYCLPSGSAKGYKLWDLSQVRYITTYRGSFSLLDENQKAMPGDYLPHSKKPLKEKAYATFSVGPDTVKGYVAFVQKHAPHVQYLPAGEAGR